jgi:hypothetical protein
MGVFQVMINADRLCARRLFYRLANVTSPWSRIEEERTAALPVLEQGRRPG